MDTKSMLKRIGKKGESYDWLIRNFVKRGRRGW